MAELHTIYCYSFNLIERKVAQFNSQRFLGCKESDCGTYYSNGSINAFYHRLMGVPHYTSGTFHAYELYSFKKLSAKEVQSTVNQKYQTLFDYRFELLKREYENKISSLREKKANVQKEIESNF